MPLTWDYTETPDFDALSDDLKQITPFACMGVGINHITEKNVQEFYARVSFYERLMGAYRNAVDASGERVMDVYFTVDECKSLVGTRTNVSPMTTAQFHKHMWQSYTRWNVDQKFVG